MQRSQTVASGPVPAWTHAPGHKKKGLPRHESGPGNNNSSNSKGDGFHASQNVGKPGRSRKHSGGPPGMQGGSASSGSVATSSTNGHSSASAKSRTSQESRRQRSLSSNGYQGSGQQQTGHFGGRSKQGKQADAANTAARAKNLDPSLIQSLHQMVRSGGTSLDLSRRDFGPEHVHVLAEALKGNRSVSKLNLSHNPIGDQGCELLADALRFNSGLKEIDLSFTESTGNGVRALCKKLKESKWLKARVRKLNLAGNRHGARGPTAIYRTLSFASSLRELTLDRMNHEGAERLASALASNQTPLARLALLHCDLDEAFVGSVAKIVQEHASLRALTVGDFPRPPAADAAIDKADVVVMVEAAATTRMGSLNQLLQPLALGASRLEELTLCSLVVTETELELLGRALAGDRHLKKLALEDALCSATESPQFTQYVQLHPFVQSIEGLVLGPPSVDNSVQVVPATNQVSEHQETMLNRNDAIIGEINPPIRSVTAATTMGLHQALPSFVEAAPMNLGWNFAPPPAAVDEAQSSIATSLSRDPSPSAGLIGLPPPGFHAAAVHANAQHVHQEQLPPLMPGLGPGATPHVDADPAQLAPPGFDPSHWGNIDPHLQEEIMSGFGGLWPANSSSSSSSSSSSTF